MAINWEQDYKEEFICPKCNNEGMSIKRIIENNKRRFHCRLCNNTEQSTCSLNIQPVKDLLNPGLYWYTDHRIEDFICYKCQDKNIYFQRIEERKINKIARFFCRTCKSSLSNLSVLCAGNFSKNSIVDLPIQAFKWENDIWDLRAINPKFDLRDRMSYFANFVELELDWFKDKCKMYTEYSCKIGNSLQTIKNHLHYLKTLHRYLYKNNVSGFHEINRTLILNYLSEEKTINFSKLGSLRVFFETGNNREWFDIAQNVIRDSDYPKVHRSDPDPISNIVREQIEQNLHLLPDPIARMWLIGYFSAMRPAELALLKRDCLVQEGQYWKIVWHQKKNNEYHEIPITRTIAKVIQEQQEYIKNIWGDEWKYLFCHYHNLSSRDPFQSKIKPVQKILPPQNSNPLLISIRTLIRHLNICDENGQQSKFIQKILRPTRLTELFAQGHDLAIVSAWAGHKHFVTTSTYYTEVSCDLIQKEVGHIQKALVNAVDINGHPISYESYPKSFWDNPIAHKLELAGTHINTPIYGKCGIPLTTDCHKFRACYTCQSFVATLEKMPQYIKTRDELRAKQANSMSVGQEILVEIYGTQADQLDKIIAGLQPEAV
jgi:integrase